MFTKIGTAAVTLLALADQVIALRLQGTRPTIHTETSVSATVAPVRP